jgi:3-methyladenine DNA glycosylase Tag
MVLASVEIPAETVESRALSKDLKRRGFRFVGPTVCYAFMQAVGLVVRQVPTIGAPSTKLQR